MISEEYRQMNKDLHAARKTYGASGHRWAEYLTSVVSEGVSVLDYGCGKGTLKAALPDMDIREYDPAVEGKDAPPDEASIVVCTDVLEHIEPEFLDSVLAHIKSLAVDAALLVVATRPANKTLPDGRNAHLIIEGPDWWRDKISEHFEVVVFNENQSQPGEFACLCK